MVGMIGATSLVGRRLTPLLAASGARVAAFSRRGAPEGGDPARWFTLPEPGGEPLAASAVGESVPLWVCAAPIWCLPEHFGLLEVLGARRVAAVSSTSLYTKSGSSDPAEQEVARRLASAEEELARWAGARGVEWVILRPTLIYGGGEDKNIAQMARFIRRFGFFPVFGQASGKRRPVHARDVAAACARALFARVSGRAYDISGASTLTYREMAEAVFRAMGRAPRLVPVPLGLIRAAVGLARLLPPCRGWSAAMAERMNRDMDFGHGDAARDFGFDPGRFELTPEDVRP